MKHVSGPLLLAFTMFAVMLITLRPWRAAAFAGSEEQQFRGDIREAVARARDFKREMVTKEKEENVLEKYGYEARDAREAAAAKQEAERRDFVRARNNQPSEQDERDRLEREDDRKRAHEEEIEDLYRRQYVLKRNRVREVLQREAYIDEAKEYGL